MDIITNEELRHIIEVYQHPIYDLKLGSYSPDQLIEGIHELGIMSAEEIYNIMLSNHDNLMYIDMIKEINNKNIHFRDRFKIERGLTKSEYKKILKDTQEQINILLEKSRNGPSILHDLEREDYIIKKNKIKKIIEFTGNRDSEELNIQKAKQHPIENLLDFNNIGWTLCLWHQDGTPSLKIDKRRNKCHCFACGVDKDAIDVYQQLNNVDFITATKALQ
jgi:hypothetical protein